MPPSPRANPARCCHRSTTFPGRQHRSRRTHSKRWFALRWTPSFRCRRHHRRHRHRQLPRPRQRPRPLGCGDGEDFCWAEGSSLLAWERLCGSARPGRDEPPRSEARSILARLRRRSPPRRYPRLRWGFLQPRLRRRSRPQTSQLQPCRPPSRATPGEPRPRARAARPAIFCSAPTSDADSSASPRRRPCISRSSVAIPAAMPPTWHASRPACCTSNVCVIRRALSACFKPLSSSSPGERSMKKPAWAWPMRGGLWTTPRKSGPRCRPSCDITQRPWRAHKPSGDCSA